MFLSDASQRGLMKLLSALLEFPLKVLKAHSQYLTEMSLCFLNHLGLARLKLLCCGGKLIRSYRLKGITDFLSELLGEGQDLLSGYSQRLR